MSNLRRFLRIRTVIGFVCWLCLMTVSAHSALAAVLPPCVPGIPSSAPTPGQYPTSPEWEIKQCAAENAVYATWEPKLLALDTAHQEMVKAANRSDWTTWRKKWQDALPLMKQLQAEANAHRELPASAGVRYLADQEITYYLRNARLGLASDFDSASARILANVGGPKAVPAALAGNAVAGRFVTLGIPLAKALGSAARGPVQREQMAQMQAQVSQVRQRREGRTMSGHVDGFGDRMGEVWKGTGVLLLIVGLGASWLAKSGKHPNPTVVGLTAAVAYLIPGTALAVSYVVMPFLPGWLMITATLLATAAMYWRGDRLLDAVAARLGDTRVASGVRRMAALLRHMRQVAHGHGNKFTDPVSAMAASKPTHGSARWGTVAEMAAWGHVTLPGQGRGFALGRIPGVPDTVDARFRFTGHVVTVAPTGSGKGIGAVIPNLLEYPGSALVLDVKGENTAVTARARRQMGQQVWVIDPFGVTGQTTHCFNLLDRLDPASADCVSESAAIADALVIMAHADGGDHFDESAKTFLQGLMLHVVASSKTGVRNLGELRRLLTADSDKFLETLANMAANDAIAFGLPARAANTLMGMADRERGSVLSNARRHTAFLDDPRIATTLSRSDFDLNKVKTDPMTLYLVLSANRIGPNARFVRGLVNAVITAVTASTIQPEHPVAFLLDEFGQLGYMKAIEDAVSLMRGYGLSFWVFVQDLSQLKGVYPRWQTFLANSAKTFYGVDDYDTAKYVSDTLGQATIEYATHNAGENSGSGVTGGGGSMNSGTSAGTSQQFTGRHILTPDEVMRLGPEQPLVLVKGEYPYRLVRLNYLTDYEYETLADPNPYHP